MNIAKKMAAPMLNISDLSIYFTQYERGLRQKTVHVMQGLALSINEGEVLAVIGSSGSGKSLLAHAILGILPNNATVTGEIAFCGERLTEKRLGELRGQEIVLIPQSVNYLNPLMKVGKQVRLSRKNEGSLKKTQRDIFKRYALDESTESLFPFQLSGGMARRTLIASAVISGAQLIICDEPTTGLHEEIVEETLTHLRELADERRAVMLITHDIKTALTIADKIAVLYAGKIVEIALAQDFSGEGERLRHPYSQALWRALPQNDFTPIKGSQPSLPEIVEGCSFAPRCPLVTEKCKQSSPKMIEVRGGEVSCYHAT